MKHNNKAPKENNPFNVFSDDASLLSGVISSAYKEAEIQDKIREEVRKQTANEILKSMLNKMYKLTGCGVPYHVKKFIEEIAIEDGIGDVSEWKHRAEVAEHKIKIRDIALLKMAEIIDWDRGTDDETPQEYVKYLLQQAEKELQEERKDD